MELDKLPPDIQEKIMGVEADRTFASAVQNLVERERRKLDNEATPITAEFRRKRTGLAARVYGQYEYLGTETLRNLEDIKNKMEELTVLIEHPVAMRARGVTRSHVEGGMETLKEAEERMYLRGLERNYYIQLGLEKDVKKANHIYNLMKKITTNKE